MQLEIGLINSSNQFILGTFNKGTDTTFKTLNLDNLDSTPMDCLFFNDTAYSENQEIKALLAGPRASFPIRKIDSQLLEFKEFEKWDFLTAQESFQKYRDSWVLKNNLDLLGEIFPTVEHLQALWPNDRTAFFEEFWSILRFNLNTKKLTIIFNDMRRGVKEHEKNKLIQTKIEGTTTPNPVEAGEFEGQAMKHYQDIITNHFEIISYEKNKGEIVMTAKINKSPVLIFAEVFNMTKLQETLISSLVMGLQAKK